MGVVLGGAATRTGQPERADRTPADDRRRTIVVGLGNPLLGDDGVGWQVVNALAGRLAPLAPTVELDRLAVGGLGLMERLVGFERAILVDALVGGETRLGGVSVGPLSALELRSADGATVDVLRQHC